MLTYFGIPLLLKAINQKYGTAFNINAIPASVFAIIAFAFNEAAYASETIRAAILSVDPGEIEAARSLGMTNRQVYLLSLIHILGRCMSKFHGRKKATPYSKTDSEIFSSRKSLLWLHYFNSDYPCS